MFHMCFAPVLHTAHTCEKNILCIIYAAHTLHIRSTNINVYVSYAFGAHTFHSLNPKNDYRWKWTTPVLTHINSSDIDDIAIYCSWDAKKYRYVTSSSPTSSGLLRSSTINKHKLISEECQCMHQQV